MAALLARFSRKILATLLSKAPLTNTDCALERDAEGRIGQVAHVVGTLGQGGIGMAKSCASAGHAPTPVGFEAFFPTIEQRGLTLENTRGLTDMATEIYIDMIGAPLSDDDVELIFRARGV
ncbi:MAG: hypothetical protein JWR17_2973 [Pseudomonas sp.]|jgi:hypothetical protein|uniref:hypothetical protein n=1 Tax=Pseudomonas sp. TaxID=306 RepID=UPI00262EA892|nr:hypothetical protein [Pseudomonas sp.]MDB6050227.1 hypothetical protein [Pseudomonas sp.]